MMHAATFMKGARRIGAALVALGLVAGAAPSAFAQQSNEGWWIVVGSFPTEPWQRQTADFETMNAKAAPCGLELFNDFSAKFEGFRPGFNVFVVGAFASKAAAQNELGNVRGCFADAYVKYGRYLGE